MKRLKRLVAAKDGAVAAEFAIAFMPLAFTFFSFTQVAQLYTAHLVFKHAALAAARAAIVTVGPCNPGKNKDGKDPKDVREAAWDGLGKGSWQHRFANVNVQTTYGGDQYGDVRTKTTGRFKCMIPLGKNIVCQMGYVSMEQEYVMPHQSARYDNVGCK